MIALTLDLYWPLGVAGGIFHTATICICIAYKDIKAIAFFTGVAILCTIAGYYFSSVGGDPLFVFINRVAAIAALLLVGASGLYVSYQHQKKIDELANLIRLDDLTGLRNRRDLEERMTDMCDGLADTQYGAGLLLVDIDNFKRLNDSFGHGKGDKALQLVAERIRRASRSSDVVTRWGGDEFAIACTHVDDQFLTQMGESIRLAITDEPLKLDDATAIQVTASIAAAIWDQQESPSQLFDRCDKALYQAKREGKNRTHLAPPPKTMGKALSAA